MQKRKRKIQRRINLRNDFKGYKKTLKQTTGLVIAGAGLGLAVSVARGLKGGN